MTREEFEQAKTASNELAATLSPYTDEAALTLLLCAVIGIAMHGRITPAQVIKTLTEIYGELDAPEESMN